MIDILIPSLQRWYPTSHVSHGSCKPVEEYTCGVCLCVQGFHKLSQAKVFELLRESRLLLLPILAALPHVYRPAYATQHITTRHVAPLPMFCIRLYSQYVVVSTCIKCVPFAYISVCLRQANKLGYKKKEVG